MTATWITYRDVELKQVQLKQVKGDDGFHRPARLEVSNLCSAGQIWPTEPLELVYWNPWWYRAPSMLHVIYMGLKWWGAIFAPYCSQLPGALVEEEPCPGHSAVGQHRLQWRGPSAEPRGSWMVKSSSSWVQMSTSLDLSWVILCPAPPH